MAAKRRSVEAPTLRIAPANETNAPPPVSVADLVDDGEDCIPLWWNVDPDVERARREREALHRQEQEETCRRKREEDPLDGLLYLKASAIVGAAAHAEVAARPIDYVWQGVACPGNVVLVAGLPGSGKTSLVYLLFCARRNRASVPIAILGHVMKPADPAKLLVLIQEEHGEISSARKMRASCDLLGLPANTLDGVISLSRKQAANGSPLWNEIAVLVKRGCVDSIWIDSLARFQRGDSDSEEEQAALFEEVQRVVESAPGDDKPIVWFVAHSKKGSQGQSTEDISGSTQRVAQADSVLIVTAERDNGRVVSARVVFIKVREDDGDLPEPATFTIARGAGGKRQVTWETTAPRAELHEQISAALAAGPLTKSELRKALKRNDVAIEAALSVLFAEHRARKVRKKVGGREWAAFALAGVVTDDLFAFASAHGESP